MGSPPLRVKAGRDAAEPDVRVAATPAPLRIREGIR
jgi:hypothetical protein